MQAVGADIEVTADQVGSGMMLQNAGGAVEDDNNVHFEMVEAFPPDELPMSIPAELSSTVRPSFLLLFFLLPILKSQNYESLQIFLIKKKTSNVQKLRKSKGKALNVLKIRRRNKGNRRT